MTRNTSENVWNSLSRKGRVHSRRDASQRQQVWGGGEMLSSTTAGGGQLETLANPTHAHPRIRSAQKRGLDMPLTTVGPTQMRDNHRPLVVRSVRSC